MKSFIVILLMVQLLFCLGGCSLKGPLVPEENLEEAPVDQFEGQLPETDSMNWVQRFGKYKFEMKLDPIEPKTNEKVNVEFRLSDTSQNPEWPARKALIACQARMPNVPGHIHVMKAHRYHPENLPGQYQMVPIKFDMGGRWDLVVQVMPADGQEFSAVFPIEVQGPPWPPNYVSPEEGKMPSRQESIRKRAQ